MQLNSYKNYKDKGLLVVIGMVLAYCLMLFPLMWGNGKTVRVEKFIPTTHKINLLKSEQNRQPGDLNSEKNAQEMPVLIGTENHQRFIELCQKYNLPPDVIWNTENYYGLKEGTILCIAIAETSGGTKGWGKEGCWNYGNVGNNDGGSRHCFPNQGAGLAAIGKTLKNNMLKNNQTIACLNGAGDCIEPNASGYRYSTGKSGNWQRNMIGCFYTIYQERINPSTFNLHNR